MSWVFSSGLIPMRHDLPIRFQHTIVPASAASATTAASQPGNSHLMMRSISQGGLDQNAVRYGCDTQTITTGYQIARNISPNRSGGRKLALRPVARRTLYTNRSTRPQYAVNTVPRIKPGQ